MLILLTSFVYTEIEGVPLFKVKIVLSKAVPSKLDREYVKAPHVPKFSTKLKLDIRFAGSFCLYVTDLSDEGVRITFSQLFLISTVRVIVAFLFGSNMYPVTIIVYKLILATSLVKTEKTLVVGLKVKTVLSKFIPLL